MSTNAGTVQATEEKRPFRVPSSAKVEKFKREDGKHRLSSAFRFWVLVTNEQKQSDYDVRPLEKFDTVCSPSLLPACSRLHATFYSYQLIFCFESFCLKSRSFLHIKLSHLYIISCTCTLCI